MEGKENSASDFIDWGEIVNSTSSTVRDNIKGQHWSAFLMILVGFFLN